MVARALLVLFVSSSLALAQSSSLDSRERDPVPIWSAACSASGVEVAGSGWTLRLGLRDWGRESSTRPGSEGVRRAEGAEVRIERPGVTEWFVRDERGVEHGFTVWERPAGEGALRLELGVDGGFEVEVRPDGLAARLRGPVVVGYSGLVAWDGGGHRLPARLAPTEGGLAILVDDAEAVYPLTIDPWIWVETAKLVGVDTELEDEFGYAVAIEGDTLLVGACRDDDRGLNAGAAYVFVRSGTTWTEQAKLLADDGTIGDHFGHSVALSGDWALVSAHEDSPWASTSGSAYVFQRVGTNWYSHAKLIPHDGDFRDQFSFSVALSGDLALIGTPEDDTAGYAAGSAFVFVRSGSVWTEEAELTASDAIPGDRFGGAVSLSGDTALIGAQNHDGPASLSGAAYVFVRHGTTWSQEARLTASDGESQDGFGYSVALDGDLALIGANGEDLPGYGSGAAYVFARTGTTWSEETKLEASDAASSDGFGSCVALDGIWALVGSPFKDSAAGSGTGRAYSFLRSGSTWSEAAWFDAGDAAAGDLFARSVALSGTTALIGAHMDDETDVDSGSARVFERGGGPNASCAHYCGSAINLDAYSVLSPYVLGGTYRGSVALSSPNLGAVLAGYLGALVFPLWGQEGLVNVATPEVMGLPSAFGASPVTISWSVPNEPAYAGFHVYTQAAGVGGGVITLTCAFDCTVGF